MAIKLKQKNNAQSVLEFCVLIAIITAALLTSAVYIKRSVQGRLRSSSEGIGEQYSAVNTDSDVLTSTDSMVTKNTFLYKLGDGPFSSGITSETITDETNTRSGYEEMGAGEELF